MFKLHARRFSTGALNEIRSFNQLPGPWPSVPLLGTSWQYMKPIGKCLADCALAYWKFSNLEVSEVQTLDTVQ